MGVNVAHIFEKLAKKSFWYKKMEDKMLGYLPMLVGVNMIEFFKCTGNKILKIFFHFSEKNMAVEKKLQLL